MPRLIEGQLNKERARRLCGFLQQVPGTPFALPGEFLSHEAAAAREDVEWVEHRLGVSILGYDKMPAMQGSLDSFTILDEQELRWLVESVNRLLLDSDVRADAVRRAEMPGASNVAEFPSSEMTEYFDENAMHDGTKESCLSNANKRIDGPRDPMTTRDAVDRHLAPVRRMKP